MKKVLLTLITIFSFFIFSKETYALTYYEKFEVYASFEENVKIEEVGDILVGLDVSGEEKGVILTRMDRYRKEFNVVPINQTEFLYALSKNDRLSEKFVLYTEGLKTTNDGKDAYLEVVVGNIDDSNRVNNIQLNEDQKSIISGGVIENTDPSIQPTTKVVQTTATAGDTGGIIIDDDDETTTVPITTSPVETTSRTLSRSEEMEIKRRQKAAEKQVNKSKNRTVLKVMLIIFGIVVLAGVLIASVNILNANK